MGTRLSITEEEKDKLYSIRDFWKGKTVSDHMDSWYPDGYEEWCAIGASSYFPGKPIGDLPSGHLTAGYPKIINVGYAAIRKQAQDWVDAHQGQPDGGRRREVHVLQVRRPGLRRRHRHDPSATPRPATARPRGARTPRARPSCEKMGDGLMWISEKPARTFWEAVQATIMYQLLLYMDARYPALAFGRFDQYTWPFLEADLEAGRLTMEEAQEIVDAFLLKANCFYRAAPPFLNEIVGVGNTYQHTTIGGVDPDTGEDATNPVTYMILESMGRLLLHDPTISIRIHKNTPDDLWERAIEMTKLVGGLPLFQNDEVIVPALVESGFELRDARDYSLIGCQEIVGSGNDYPAPNGTMCKATIHYGVILDMALNNGTNPMNGRSGALKTGYLYDMESFDEVKAAVKAQVEYFLRWLVTMNNYSEHVAMIVSPHAALSISIEGCMESGKDCVRGGAKYNSFGGTATGLATVADSLTTIRYMVFDKKLCTARELYDAYMADWEGYEPLRQRILSEVPHFGNNDPYADEQMKWICDVYYDACREMYSDEKQAPTRRASTERPTTWRKARTPGRPPTDGAPASPWPTPPLRRRAGICTVPPACSTPSSASTTATYLDGIAAQPEDPPDRPEGRGGRRQAEGRDQGLLRRGRHGGPVQRRQRRRHEGRAEGPGRLPQPGGPHRRLLGLLRRAQPQDAERHHQQDRECPLERPGSGRACRDDLRYPGLLRPRRSGNQDHRLPQGLPPALSVVPQSRIAALRHPAVVAVP